MADAPKEPKAEAKEQPAPAPKTGFKLDELGPVSTVLVAIGGGLGVLGFVAFFGAAILWVRTDQAGLPGNDAVAIVPKSVLIATGASFLVPALLIALAFTVLVYLVDTIAGWISEIPLENEQRRLARAREAQRLAEHQAQALETTLEVAEKNRDAAEEESAMPMQVEANAENALRSVSAPAVSAKAESVLAKKNTLDLERELKAKKRESVLYKAADTIRTTILIVCTILLFIGGTWLMLDEYSVESSPGRFLVLAGVTTMLITFCVLVRLRTKNFAWFAVAIFIAVGAMIGVLTYYRTVDNPKVEPAALLRTHGPPVFGFYIAQTSDRVYLGSQPRAGESRLDSIPREEVIGLVVGSLQSPTVAEEHAIAFARQLCRRALRREATGKVAGSDHGGKEGEEIASGCTGADLRWLRRYGGG